MIYAATPSFSQKINKNFNKNKQNNANIGVS